MYVSGSAYNKRHRHLTDCLLHLHHCSKRDYQGAIAVLLFKRHANRNDVRTSEFLAYAHFHYGEHDKVRGTLRDKAHHGGVRALTRQPLGGN